MMKGTYDQPNGSEDAERHLQRRNHNDHWQSRIQSVLRVVRSVV